MSALRVPVWRAVLPHRSDQILSAFRSALSSGVITHTELADALGVAQPTVTRWAQGQREPSLDQMCAVVEVIRERARSVSAQMEATAEVMQLTEELTQHRLA